MPLQQFTLSILLNMVKVCEKIRQDDYLIFLISQQNSNLPSKECEYRYRSSHKTRGAPTWTAPQLSILT